MASQKEIRQRIVSVSSTKQITSAMKMVAAAKLRKAQDRITRLRPYANKMQLILKHISDSGSVPSGNPLLNTPEPEKILLVTITSQRGLCGALNANTARKALEVAKNEFAAAHSKNQVHYMALGKKGFDMLKKRGCFMVNSPVDLEDTPDFNQVVPLADHLMHLFVSGEYTHIVLVYNQFRNAAVHQLTAETFLPLARETQENPVASVDYIFEPDRTTILNELIPRTLKLQVYKALTESAASEHGARMMSMTQATDNATQLISDLTLQYNKARQAAITSEISEIVSGAAALRG